MEPSVVVALLALAALAALVAARNQAPPEPECQPVPVRVDDDRR